MARKLHLTAGVRYDTLSEYLMPRLRLPKKQGPKVTKVTRDGILARKLIGQSDAQIAHDAGVSPRVVANIISKAHAITQSIEPGLIPALKARLGDLLTLLATQHATTAMLTAEDNPSDSAKSTWASKMALEASRLSDMSAGAGISVAMLFGSLGAPKTQSGASGEVGALDPETTDSLETVNLVTPKIPLDKSPILWYKGGNDRQEGDTQQVIEVTEKVIPSSPPGNGRVPSLLTTEGKEVDREFITRWFEDPDLERQLDLE